MALYDYDIAEVDRKSMNLKQNLYLLGERLKKKL
jgi:hypothetical protein